MVGISPVPALRWWSVQDVNEVDYCADLESAVARCPDLVGGKGASLALLTSIQEAQVFLFKKSCTIYTNDCFPSY